MQDFGRHRSFTVLSTWDQSVAYVWFQFLSFPSISQPFGMNEMGVWNEGNFQSRICSFLDMWLLTSQTSFAEILGG